MLLSKWAFSGKALVISALLLGFGGCATLTRESADGIPKFTADKDFSDSDKHSGRIYDGWGFSLLHDDGIRVGKSDSAQKDYEFYTIEDVKDERPLLRIYAGFHPNLSNARWNGWHMSNPFTKKKRISWVLNGKQYGEIVWHIHGRRAVEKYNVPQVLHIIYENLGAADLVRVKKLIRSISPQRR